MRKGLILIYACISIIAGTQSARALVISLKTHDSIEQNSHAVFGGGLFTLSFMTGGIAISLNSANLNKKLNESE
jgi:hypothetical protein